MKKIIISLAVVLSLYSCEELNLRDDIKSSEYIQLNSIRKVIITRDNGLLITGESASKATFIKTDANFKTSWRKDNFTWGNNHHGSWGESTYSFEVVNIFQNENGNYTCFGSVMQGGCVVFTSSLIVELSSKGEEQKKIEIPDFALYNSVQTSDGGYLLTGTKLLKLDRNLKKTWEKDFWSQGLMIGDIICTRDGRYALTCRNDNNQCFLKTFDNNGNELSSETFSFGEMPLEELGFGLTQLNDRGFIIVGRTRNNFPPFDMDFGMTRINESGGEIWKSKFGNGSDEWLEKFIYYSDDEYIVQGNIGFPGDANQKSKLLRIDINGNITDSCSFNKIDLLLYNPREYFIKAVKADENNFNLSKIPFSAVFDLR